MSNTILRRNLSYFHAMCSSLQRFMRTVGPALLAVWFVSTYAYAEDGSSFPPEDDPSRFGDLVTGDLPEGLQEANEGAFEGGNTGTGTDAGTGNVLQAEDQRDDGRFNVPTNGPPSPLFGAEAFTQQMLRFEEFGTDVLKFRKRRSRDMTGGKRPLPAGLPRCLMLSLRLPKPKSRILPWMRMTCIRGW